MIRSLRSGSEPQIPIQGLGRLGLIAGAANAAAFLDAAVSAGLNPAARRTTELVALNFATKAEPAELSKLIAALAGKPAVAEPILAGLAAGWPADKTAKLTPAAEAAVAKLLPAVSAAARGRLLTLEGRSQNIKCPLLVVFGAGDRLISPAEGERLAKTASGPAELVVYPEGNHVCFNISYKFRPLTADWTAERLAALA